MEIIYLLVPLAAILAVAIAWGLLWAIRTGQFDDLDRPGHEVLWDEPARVDKNKSTPALSTITVEKSKHPGCANVCSNCPDAH